MIVYHIIENKNVFLAEKVHYTPATLETDTFTHLSLKHQVGRVANSLYSNYTELYVLEIDSMLLEDEHLLVMEDLYQANEDFPHYYGPLNVSSVVHIHTMHKSEQGLFEF